MAAYVDKLLEVGPRPGWPFRRACHLVADDEMELHAFARRLWPRREWYQTSGWIPHYDLTATKRRQALRMGAIEISGRDLIRMFEVRRQNA